MHNQLTREQRKAFGRERYLRRYENHPPAPAKRKRIHHAPAPIGSLPNVSSRFSFFDLLAAFRAGPPIEEAKPTPKPSKFVLIGVKKGVNFFKATWNHLSRSKYANGARAQRGDNT